MDQLLSNDLTVASLLVAFIIGIFTKRFVPWWIHEEVLNKLKEYEKNTPELIDEMQRLMEIIQSPNQISHIQIEAPKAEQVDIRAGVSPKTQKPPAVVVRRRRVPTISSNKRDKG